MGRGRNFCLQKFLTGLAGLVYFTVTFDVIPKLFIRDANCQVFNVTLRHADMQIKRYTDNGKHLDHCYHDILYN